MTNNNYKFNLNIQEIDDIVNFLVNLINHNAYRYFLLKGSLGAGKSFLTSKILSKLNLAKAASSPTFSIINKYYSDGVLAIHSDLYRIRSEAELEQIDFYGELEVADIAFIEWSDNCNIKMYLKKYVEIIIEEEEDGRIYNVYVK